MKRIFSGVQPSGNLTLGNYLGAIRNFVSLQHEAECLFCVVDLHALTVPQEPALLRERTLDVARLFVASGIDPDISNLFVQSHVPEHTEMGWLLECTVYFGELRRMTQFKEKAARNVSVTGGLFTYPVLMAADILLYDTDAVPVGEDQQQHVELCRDLARRIQARFGPIVRVPEALVTPRTEGGRIMSLTDPARKMEKSAADERSYIALLDPPDVVAAKIRGAVTDSGREVVYDPVEKPAISNLMVIYGLCAGVPLESVADRFAGKGYGTFKKELADVVIATLEPIQARYRSLVEPGVIEGILAQGRRRVEPRARATLERFREALGLVPRTVP